MAGKTVGRKPKLTRELKQRLLILIRAGVPTETACMGAGIAKRTLNIWRARARDPEDPRHQEFVNLEEELEKAQAEAKSSIIVDIRRAGKQDWRALAWMMERVYGFVEESRLILDADRERMFDVATSVLGAEAAAKLFAAIAGRDGAEAAYASRERETPRTLQ